LLYGKATSTQHPQENRRVLLHIDKRKERACDMALWARSVLRIQSCTDEVIILRDAGLVNRITRLETQRACRLFAY